MLISEKTKKFSSLAKNLGKVTTDWLMSNNGIIIDELRLQWNTGDAEKGKMPVYKSPAYQLKKEKDLGSQSGMYYDLKVHEDFRDGMFASRKAKGIQISSKDSKMSKINKLTRSQGAEIWKLNTEHKANFKEMALPEYQQKIKNELK